MNYHNNLSRLTKFLIYGISFIANFNFIFDNYVTDGKPTSGMFLIVSIILTGATIAVYLLLIRLLKRTTNTINNFYDALLLYISSEISFIITGEPGSFFGLRYILHLYNKDITPDLLQIRIDSERAFSLSFLIAAIIYFTAAQLLPKKEIQ